MSERVPDLDPRSMVIVPAQPGPIVRLQDLDGGRDEIDALLDEVFGQPDDRGPGPVDAVLVLGGIGALIAGAASSSPTIVAVGGVGAALGAVLPVRALWRRVASARRSRRLRSLLGRGVLLRIDHRSVVQLLAAHERLIGASSSLAAPPRARVQAVAHAAVLEVASLLGGRSPVAEAEEGYVAARTHALADLASTVADPRVGDGERDRRRALVEARHEVEQLAGSSSLTEASDLSRQLLAPDEP